MLVSEMFEENEDKQFMFVENCCKNYPKAECYYELLKLAQKKKLRNVSELLQLSLKLVHFIFDLNFGMIRFRVDLFDFLKRFK